ncbi:MAG: hypothetical protein ACYCYR_09615 [Desulfobulbaceae bacterium]
MSQTEIEKLRIDNGILRDALVLLVGANTREELEQIATTLAQLAELSVGEKHDQEAAMAAVNALLITMPTNQNPQPEPGDLQP